MAKHCRHLEAEVDQKAYDQQAHGAHRWEGIPLKLYCTRGLEYAFSRDDPVWLNRFNRVCGGCHGRPGYPTPNCFVDE